MSFLLLDSNSIGAARLAALTLAAVSDEPASLCLSDKHLTHYL